MNYIDECKAKVFVGKLITREEAVQLSQVGLKELMIAADEIRMEFCGNNFDICTIVNGKCGKCSEDCKYCAQSIHYGAECPESTPLLPLNKLLEQAAYSEKKGVLRYAIVTSGKRLSDCEITQVCESIKRIKEETDIQVCVSFGILEEKQFQKLKEAGVTRVHCNLETSENYFPNVCTTHTFREKIETLIAAKRVGLEICSGGIMGLGESMEDRIDMVLAARELGVKSIPVNVLNPIPGTPYVGNKRLTSAKMCRIVAVFRFLIPDASIRLAGGRGLLPDKGEACFQSGANAAISGEMLTTAGISIDNDMRLIKKLGYKVVLNE
jgi:biotin synthase